MSRRLVLASLACLSGLARSAPAEGDYGGRYALLQETTVVAKVPVVPDLVTTTQVVTLVDLRQDDSSLSGQGRVCQLQMKTSSKLVRTELPAAFVQALPPARIEARLERAGADLRFYQPATTVVLGAKLEDPRRDVLPRTAADARVFDQDRDGHPGMTVRVSGIVGGEVYFVQRGTTELRGRLEGRAFSGKVRFETEDSILGATSALLKMRTNTRPDFERSRFRLVPVPAGATCRDAEALGARWF